MWNYACYKNNCECTAISGICPRGQPRKPNFPWGLIVSFGFSAPASSALATRLERWVSTLHFSRWPIGTRISALVLALLVLLNLVTIGVIWHLAESASEAQRTSLMFTARSVVGAADAKLDKYMALAQALARSPALLDDNLDAFETEARRAFASSPDVLVVVADNGGRQILNTARKLGEARPFRDPIGLDTEERAFESRRTTISDVNVDRGSQQWVVHIEVPIFKEGEPFRTLVAAVKAQSFFHLLNAQEMPKNWLAGIMDNQGRYIARVPGDESYIGQLGSEGWRKVKDQIGVFEILSREGDVIVSANVRSAMSGWAVGVAVKKAEMQAATWRAVRWAIILGGGFSIMSLLLAGIIARSITGPIDGLRSKSAALLGGPLRGLPAVGPPEVKELWQALHLSAAVRDRSEAALRESEERFRGIFEHAATGIAIGDLEGRYQSGNPAFCSILGFTKEEVRALTVRDLVHPEDFEACMSNFRRLVAQEVSSFEALNRYVAKDGRPVWVHKHVSLLRDDKGTPVNALALVTDVTERRRAEEAVRGSELRYRQLVEQMSDAIFVADAQGRFVETSAVGCAMLGMTRGEVLSSSLTDIIIPEEHHCIAPEIARFDDGGIYTSEWRVRRKDGSVFIGEVVARKLANGNLQGVVRDISVRKRHDDQIRLLMGEVNHRSKNMLAVVQAVARQTVAANPDDFLERFGKRVEALAANQDLLVKNAWKGVDLNELVRSQLGHFEDQIGTRIALEGPTLIISAPAAQALGMALHELATNAGKYGALSGANGFVDIAWRVTRGQRNQEKFVMSWRERCAHSITAPSKLGFGSSVISSMAEMSLGAQVELDYPSTGLTWQLSCAAGEVVEGGPVPSIASESSTASGNERPNQRPCVLVVEDEALVAMEIAHALTGAGFDVIGPARNVPTALELLNRRGCDAAVLDINLGHETSEAIAIELTANQTPFVTLSGYSSEQHHPVFAGAPALRKPLRLQFLVAEVKKCVGQKHSGPVDRTAAFAE
jgi:PAS domain S-box-containing protein